jgi:2-dehydropantoate 2-reductase
MRFAFIGAGAVGGYYAALLSRAGHDVSVLARGAHLEAIRRDGLTIKSAAVGDFAARVTGESDPARLGPVDVAVLAVKTYDNATAIPLMAALAGPGTTLLTLQNGVDSAEEVAAVVGEAATIAGATYIATAIESPGVITQTGSHRRIVFGEWFGDRQTVSDRVRAIEAALVGADIHGEAVVDARIPIWEKFIYLAPFASITGAARQPIGPIWADDEARSAFLAAVAETAEVARASGIAISPETQSRIETYTSTIPPTTRSSLLIDLSQGKRIEVESLPGSVVRRGRAVGVPTPMMRAWYAALKVASLTP